MSYIITGIRSATDKDAVAFKSNLLGYVTSRSIKKLKKKMYKRGCLSSGLLTCCNPKPE
jgi:hypothetical protein